MDVAQLHTALTDRYRIERELGRGGMATVFLARDLKHDRPVALKLLRPELGPILGAERFLREIQVTARLQHPHILPLHDSGTAGEHVFYVMPYVDGESLRDRLVREGQLPLDEALRIARAVASALAYAHEMGVVHRDIKPENILLTRQGEALVADFGIARALASGGEARLTETGLAVGTPAYMAPEQATGDAVDARADVYALGCVLYEMLTGEPPYTGATAQAIIAKRLSEPVPRVGTLRQVPAALEAAVARALARAPADRFPTAAAFGSALASESRTTAVSQRRLPSRRVVALASAAAIIAVAGVVALRRAGGSTAGLDPRRVAVAVFENRTGEPSLDPLGLTVADYVSRALLKTGLVSVGDIGTLYNRGRDRSGQPADARSLARAAGAAKVIIGSYAAAGDSVELAAAVLDVASASLRQSFEPVRAQRSDPMSGLARLQRRVAAGLATTVDPRFSTFAAQAGAPPSYEAYRAFAEGQERFWGRGGSDSTSQALFRQAATADPEFLTAAVWLAFGSAAPLTGCGVTDSLVRALAPMRQRLDPLDRYNLDWSEAYCRGDAEALYRIALASADLQPSSAYARYWVALWASFSNRQHEAIRILTHLDRSLDLAWMPDSAKFLYFRDLTRSYHLAGDYAHELEAARQYTDRDPHAIRSLWLRGRALAGLGRGRESLVLLDSARGRPDDENSWDVHSAAYFGVALAHELDFHGDSASARIAALRALEYFHQRTDTLVNAEMRWAALRIGRRDEAHHLLGLTRDRRFPAMWVGAAGSLALAEGDTMRARAMDDSLARGPWPYQWGRALLERARLAAARGDRERAVEILRTYQAQYGPFVAVVVHLWPGMEPLRGYPPFDALLRDGRER